MRYRLSRPSRDTRIPQDFFRKSITPEYTDIQRVDRDRVRGIVEFATRDDLKRAIRDLDGAPLDIQFLPYTL